jgi:hypothetical protein
MRTVRPLLLLLSLALSGPALAATIYICDRDGELAVHDTTAGTTTHLLSLSGLGHSIGRVQGLAFDLSAGRLLVLDRDDQTVYEVDPGAGSASVVLSPGVRLQGGAFSGGILYGFDADTDAMAAYDLASGSPQSLSGSVLSGMPRGLGVNGITGQLVGCRADNGDIFEIDTLGNQGPTVVSGSGALQDIQPYQGGYLVANSTSDTIDLIDGVSGAQSTFLSSGELSAAGVGTNPSGIVIGPSCLTSACGDCDDNGVYVTILDALVGAQLAAGLTTPSAAQQCACDADGSGALTILDALRMAQSAAALPVTLSCGGGGAGGGTPALTLVGGAVGTDPVDVLVNLAGVAAANLTFAFSTNGGSTWAPASAHPLSSITSPAPGIVAGLGIEFFWDSRADLPTGRPATAILEITATEPSGGATDSTTLTGITLPVLPVGPGTGSCSDPIVLTSGVPLAGSTVGAGGHATPGCAIFSSAEDQVHMIELTGTRDLSVAVTGPSYDSVLYVRFSCRYPGSELACDDSPGGQSLLLPSLPGGVYFIVVDGISSGEGTYTLTATVN